MGKQENIIESIQTSFQGFGHTSGLNNKRRYRANSEEIFYHFDFLRQLRFEMLRAQRSKSALSILLLTIDKAGGEQAIEIDEILDLVRLKTRKTDIKGFVSYKTIGVILPYTDEEGAKKIRKKLANGNSGTRFSVSISTFPDQIFESLAKTGSIQPNVFLLEQAESAISLWIRLLIKRGMDIVGAIICLITFSPVMLIAAFAVKTSSPGPVIFKQMRLGKHGVPFMLYKFRSMQINGDDQIHREYIQEYMNGHNEKINQGNWKKPLYKIKSDPRVTTVGKIIRKTSIDELPQLFNVLKGEMSLVGPRPALSYEAEKYKPWQLSRILEMKPGITGLWQVEGRGMTEWDDSVRLDIRYIRNWSLLKDLNILIRTAKRVLSCSGAA